MDGLERMTRTHGRSRAEVKGRARGVKEKAGEVKAREPRRPRLVYQASLPGSPRLGSPGAEVKDGAWAAHAHLCAVYAPRRLARIMGGAYTALMGGRPCVHTFKCVYVHTQHMCMYVHTFMCMYVHAQHAYMHVRVCAYTAHRLGRVGTSPLMRTRRPSGRPSGRLIASDEGHAIRPLQTRHQTPS
jgi:hypothetical protein